MFSILLQHDKLVLQKVWTRCISAYPHQEFCSPSFISSFCRRALSPHSLGSWGHVPLGVQGECEVGADGERKGDGLVLTCQPMAEVHVHGSQRGIHLYPSIYTIYYSSHFLEISQNLWKNLLWILISGSGWPCVQMWLWLMKAEGPQEKQK